MSTNQSQRNISSATFNQSKAKPFELVTDFTFLAGSGRDRLIERHLPNILIRLTCSPDSSRLSLPRKPSRLGEQHRQDPEDEFVFFSFPESR